MAVNQDQLNNHQFQKSDNSNKVTANPSVEADAVENIQVAGIDTTELTGQEGLELSNNLGQKPHL